MSIATDLTLCCEGAQRRRLWCDTEREIADKRADYFAVGTKAVSDVDFLSEFVVRVYRPDTPRIYGGCEPPRRS